jgi:hypothetical protein
MKKLLLLLILSFFSAQGFSGECPDGSEPVRSVSADGTYFVYNCGVSTTSSSSATNSKAGTVPLTSAVQKSTSSGNWFPTDGDIMYSPHYAKQSQELKKKSYTQTHFAFADFDNDGVEDFFIVTNPKQPGVDWDKAGPNCRTDFGACYSQQGSISLFKVEKTKHSDSFRYTATDVSGLLVDDNPIEMKGTGTNKLHLADFNGDGKVDIFAAETTTINMDFSSKNDMYFLSNEEGFGWTESTATHVIGEWCCVTDWTKGHGVKEGEGLINFSHGGTIGDIDGDGDIDIVVTSIAWHGWGKSRSKRTENGFIYCYINQGDGHMKVRQCGDQWGMTSELGDIDNDGDLDLIWGSRTMSWAKAWNAWDGLPGCTSKSHCNSTFSGVLLNDGTGNFYERGFEFDDVIASTGWAYQSTPNVAVVDLDNDDDLDVIRMQVGNLYAGAGMTIEENIGNGQFKQVFYSEFCPTPETKEEWPTQEGTSWNCWASDFKFGDFNKDGLVDIYLDGNGVTFNVKEDSIKEGTIYMSTGKFTYDIVSPEDKDYPLLEIKINKQPKIVAKVLTTEEKSEEQQSVEDEIAAFEAELAAELGQ